MRKLLKIGAVAVSAALWLGGMMAPLQAQTTRAWMSSEVADAWRAGYRGQGVSVTVIDGFKGGLLSGKMDGKLQALTHGQWTSKEVALIAPLANVYTKDFSTSASAVRLQRGLNVLNLSYAMFASPTATNINWAPEEASIITYARAGSAVVAKAAGNDAVAVGAVNAAGRVDALNTALKNGLSTLFVGALSRNGTPTAKASLASYSNYAGTDPMVQGKFLVVGVNSAQMGLAGTSFAAPIISGYAAILGSKFKTATPVQIAEQLLDTARTDTIVNYNVSVHGQGEASITRALAPRRLQ